MNRTMGYALVAGSFLGGAFLASLDADTVLWAWFVPVMAAGFAGAWMAHRADQSEARSDEVLTANRAHIEDSLGLLCKHLADIDENKDNLDGEQLREEIDTRLREDLNRFADARHSLVHIYGLQDYAEIMNSFAAGERYVNRVWSAAADGYLHEAREYIMRAHAQFDEAKAKLAAAHVRSEAAPDAAAAN